MYEIAYNIGLPLYKLYNEMPYEEFVGWVEYFNRRPVEWRDDDRTFKFLQTQGVKQKPWEIFATLGPIYRPPPKENNEGKINANNLMRSSLFQFMAKAQKGDKLDIWSKSPE